MEAYELVDNQARLKDVCALLNSASWLAVDTEFERINTYYPKLCLVQLSNGSDTFIIDPLSLNDLQPLYDLLYQHSITKVLHSAHQDLEIFFNLQGSVPLPVFDTQLAAPLFDFDKGIGYGNLIKAALEVELEKGHARADWTKRPLSDAQLQYAADDVIYLGQVYELFMTKADSLDNHDQLTQQFSLLAEPDTYQPDPARMWKKIYAAKRLRGRPLRVVKALAAWRELTARKQNRPRKWIVSDQALIDLAKLLPEDMSSMQEMNNMTDKLIQRYGDEWLSIITEQQ